MLILTFEHDQHVLLAAFSGIFTSDDLGVFDHTLRQLAGDVGGIRSIMDFTAVTAIAVPDTLILDRARAAHVTAGQKRVLVAPASNLYDMARRCADFHRDFGNLQPLLVRSLDDAFELFDLASPDFQPLG